MTSYGSDLMRFMTRTTRQCTDVSKSLVPSFLRFIFTLSRFIGLEILICALYLFGTHTRAIGVVDARDIIIKGQRTGSSASPSPTRRCMMRERPIYSGAGGNSEGWEGEGIFTE